MHSNNLDIIVSRPSKDKNFYVSSLVTEKRKRQVMHNFLIKYQ